MARVTVKSFTVDWDGRSYIKSSMISSMMPRSARAPVLRRCASWAIALIASSANFRQERENGGEAKTGEDQKAPGDIPHADGGTQQPEATHPREEDYEGHEEGKVEWPRHMSYKASPRHFPQDRAYRASAVTLALHDAQCVSMPYR